MLYERRKTDPAESLEITRLNKKRHDDTARLLILSEEDEPKFTAMLECYLDELDPSGIEQDDLVREIVVGKWRQERYWPIENALFELAPYSSEEALKKFETINGPSQVVVAMLRHEIHRPRHAAVMPIPGNENTLCLGHRNFNVFFEETQTRQPQASDLRQRTQTRQPQASDLRQRTQTGQLQASDLRQRTQTGQLQASDLRQRTQTGQLPPSDLRQRTQTGQPQGSDLRQRTQTEQPKSSDLRQRTQTGQAESSDSPARKQTSNQGENENCRSAGNKNRQPIEPKQSMTYRESIPSLSPAPIP
jgi:hypothetical protein